MTERTLYELVGKDDLRFSPYCWRTLYALAHKGVQVERVPIHFTDKSKLEVLGNTTVPVLADRDKVVGDSWDIACYLEETYPDKPSLFIDAHGEAYAMFMNNYADSQLHSLLASMIIKDIFDNVRPEDQAYFRATREERFGQQLEELHATRNERLMQWKKALTPVRRTLSNLEFLGGEEPCYVDYILFGTLQWARCSSNFEVLFEGDPVTEWFETMLDLFDGLGRSAKTPADL